MESRVRAKKTLGQHFLTDQSIAQRIVALLEAPGEGPVLEVGPGMGVLTRYLLERLGDRLWVIEIDPESVDFLREKYPELGSRLITGDFLQLEFADLHPGPWSIVGNFPYNISSQILFRVLQNRDRVVEVVGMFQREVARRLVADPGSKTYGLLSVMLDAFYSRAYAFTVPENRFRPPPKVKSGVVRFESKAQPPEVPDERLFFQVIKTAFNQRRKTLRNALSSYWGSDLEEAGYGPQRAEQLSFTDFLRISELIHQRDIR